MSFKNSSAIAEELLNLADSKTPVSMIEKWKLIEEEDVSPSKWFPVMRHTVETHHNNIIDDFYIAPFGNVVMVLPITVDSEVIFVRQYKHGAGEILIELPAGFQQKDKTIEDSALAELEEETGIKTTVDNLVSLGKLCNNPTKTTHITHGFLATGLTFNSRQNFDTTENIELVKIAPNDILPMIASGQIWVGDTVAFIMKAYLLFPDIFK